jgi:hypothetical protein
MENIQMDEFIFDVIINSGFDVTDVSCNTDHISVTLTLTYKEHDLYVYHWLDETHNDIKIYTQPNTITPIEVSFDMLGHTLCRLRKLIDMRMKNTIIPTAGYTYTEIQIINNLW